MGKKLKNMKWDSVTLEGFPASVTSNLHGFVGLEECTNYGLDKDRNKPKKKKTPKPEPQKRKPATPAEKEVPSKKVKLNNGFFVESCNSITPSQTNEETVKSSRNSTDLKTSHNICKVTSEVANKNIRKDQSKPKKIVVNSVPKVNEESKKKSKVKLGENISGTMCELTPEDMLTWAEYKLPEPIMKALAELGYKTPTKIQQLTLPPAIHGRRDILGAAETGSGKTLAFGLPILTGIIRLKEKAAKSGIDVYDIPYRKDSAKGKEKEPIPKQKKNIKKKGKQNYKVNENKKDSSEEGYSSGEENNGDDEEYVEEIVVPLRKRADSIDDGNDSDSSDHYVHLSEILDSDDSTDDDDNNDEGDKDDDEECGVEEEDMEVEDNGEGMGCVKVIDNIDNVDMPGHVAARTGKPLYALILTPTRELAIQISNHLKAAAKYTGIRIGTIVGGMAAVKQERVLLRGPEVVVATPGRLWELLGQGQPHLQQLPSLKFLAIDETDRMIERGHFEELQPLLERANADEARRRARQNFVFSATLTMVHDLPTHMKGKKVTKRGKILNRKVEKMTPEQKIKRLVTMIGMSDPKVVDITTTFGTAESLTESRITCALEHKDAYLYYVLKNHPGRTIVFCNSIGSVKRLAQLFTILKCRPLPLHASMAQRQRLKNLERFRDDPQGVLVATDVAARGLDIPDVDHVIHYQVPRTAENYVHRSGRTARAHKEGLTILMMEPKEAYLYSKLCRTLNKTSEVPTFPVSAHQLAPLRQLTALARECETLEMRRKRAAQAHGWREKVAREMDIIVDDDNAPVKETDPAIEAALRAKKRQLNALLSRPFYPQGFSFKYPTLNDPSALTWSNENALQVMKKSIESGEMKKEMRKSKNAPLLKLGKMFQKK